MNVNQERLKWGLLSLICFSFICTTSCVEESQESIRIGNGLLKDKNWSLFRTILDIRRKVINLESSFKNITSTFENIPIQNDQLEVRTDALDNSVKTIATNMDTILARNSQLETIFGNVTDEMNRMATQNNEMEASIKNITKEILVMSAHDDQLEASISQQNDFIEKLSEQVDNLKVSASKHRDAIGEIGDMVTPDENLFVLSNQTCGGVLIAQTGTIVYSNEARLRDTQQLSSCVWTIRANNRKIIKIALKQPDSSSMPNVYVIELISSQFVTNGSESIFPKVETKITKMEENMHHIFTGPVIFVVYDLISNSESELLLHYEGMGKLTGKDTLFSHEYIQHSSGNFGNSQMEIFNSNSNRNQKNVTYSKEFTSVLISNFTSTAHWKASFENGRCDENITSFLVIPDLLNNSSRDCCEASCTGNNAPINYQHPMLVIIEKRIEAPLNFTLTWESETVYTSSSTGNSYECGEILGGENGTLAYKPNLQYKNGERCIWTIVPQPLPRESIDIKVDLNGLENFYDQLYMMELVSVNGTELEGGPRITKLGHNGTYTAHSREVYIIFSSDMSIPGNGFSLSWMASGAAIKTGKDVTTRFTFLRNTNGIATTLLERPTLANEVYHVFMLTPSINLTNSHGMQLNINQKQNIRSSSCHNDTRVHAAVDGIMSKVNVDEFCNYESGSKKLNIRNTDGLAMIIVKEQSTELNAQIDYSWSNELSENTTFVSLEDNKCGGVITGDEGIVKYKFNQAYLNNERCIWLLQTPNHTSIKLKLVKDGFESCCDNILVTTIDPNNGTLRKDTTIINRQNPIQTFEQSVLVIVFQSDGSNVGQGFALQFTGSGVPEEQVPEYTYHIQHHRASSSGGLTLPGSNSSYNEGTKNIYVIASGSQDPITMPSTLKWKPSVFKMDNNCTYESVTFYTTPTPQGWFQGERFPSENQTATCESEIATGQKSTLVYSAFLVIYKQLERESQEVAEKGFIYENITTCGSVITGNSGVISYKESSQYSNYENCVWLVHVPQAQQIRLRLERSGLEECCDVLGVHKIDQAISLSQRSAIITRSNGNILVDGPTTMISFKSDGSVTGNGFRLLFSREGNIVKS